MPRTHGLGQRDDAREEVVVPARIVSWTQDSMRHGGTRKSRATV